MIKVDIYNNISYVSGFGLIEIEQGAYNMGIKIYNKCKKKPPGMVPGGFSYEESWIIANPASAFSRLGRCRSKWRGLRRCGRRGRCSGPRNSADI